MLTRRSFLRAGGLAVAGWALPARSLGVEPVPGSAYACDLSARAIASAAGVTLPPPEPFTRPLTFPAVATPVRRTTEADVYELEMRAATVELLPGHRTTIWGYDGGFPGPTIVATTGRAVHVVQHNSLQVPTVVHLHGGNIPPGQDGHPDDVIPPGTSRTYRYGNRQRAATLWYHDHANHRTGEQVYRGLAGVYLITDPGHASLGLPDGERDLVLVVGDKTFGDDGELVYSTGVNHNGFFGEVVLVNGVPQPYVELERTTYRVRIINASNARPYGLRREDGVPLTVVGTDGGLLARPVSVPTVELYPAERIELLLDLRNEDVGAQIVLGNDLGPAPLRVDVVGPGPSAAPLASTLSTIDELPAPVVTREIRLTFDADTGEWVLNGGGYDPERVDAVARLGTVERWRLINDSTHTHPIHLHLVMFRVRSRQRGSTAAQGPDAWEAGWKDTVRVRPGETVEVDARFGDHTGTYVYHCHILEHEDHDMMSQFRVVELRRLAGPGRVETAAAVSSASFEPGVSAAFVATGDGFADALAGGPAAGRIGAPVLLTRGDTLSEATAAELRRLAPARIDVLGGTKAVPERVLDELRGLTSGPVTRVAGESRWATAAAVSARSFPDGAAVAYVAYGFGFADALAGGPAAAREEAPLLLVDRDAVPAATADELRRLGLERIVLLGGEKAVSAATAAELERIAPVQRVAGASRYDTAAAVVARSFPSAETVLIATGQDFPDALAGVPAAVVHDAPLLLVAPDGVPEATATQLRRLQPSRILVLGGTKAVPAAVMEHLDTFLV